MRMTYYTSEKSKQMINLYVNKDETINEDKINDLSKEHRIIIFISGHENIRNALKKGLSSIYNSTS